MTGQTDTIAAIATPPGQGGIGIVKTSGPGSDRIIAGLCRVKPAPRECLYTAFYDEQGRIIDRGQVLFFRGPGSHTGEDIAELHGHGGPVVMSLLLNRALSLGARYARPGEFTERAFLNNKIDLLQAEAVADLISSASEQAAMSAVRSMEGQFSVLIGDLVKRIVELRAFVEATLDFPEEEIDAPVKKVLQDRVTTCRRFLEDILARAEDGRTLAEGLKIAIIGKPNVGKSSLLNQLARIERAIVSPRPGTTRDTIEQQVLINGMPVKMIDTAGIRKAGDWIEREGIRRAKAAAEGADLIILIAAVNHDKLRDLQALAGEFGVGKKVLFVFNKIDLSDCPPGKRRTEQGVEAIYLSARTGAGIDALEQAIKNSVIQADYSENTFVARTRHIKVLKDALSMLEETTDKFYRRQAIELFADDLSRVQQVLGAITGEYVADDLLGEIFSRFCIGK